MNIHSQSSLENRNDAGQVENYKRSVKYIHNKLKSELYFYQ